MEDFGVERRVQLMQQTRIRRSDEPPSFVGEEAKLRLSYPGNFTITWRGSTANLNYRRSRWFWMMEQKGEVRRRELFCWIKVGKRRVAAVQLVEYQLHELLSNEDFLITMDSHSDLDCHLAETVCEAWPWFTEEVTVFGNLLDFRMAWAHPTRSPHGLWSAAAKHVISELFPNHALLTMKAFPLEYEGNGPARSPSNAGLASRQRAMIQYYTQQFGVRPFPGGSGRDGWLYRIHPRLVDHIPAPLPGRGRGLKEPRRHPAQGPAPAAEK